MNDYQVPVMTLKVPRHEYARLIRDSERLAILLRLTRGLESYDLNKVLDVLLKVDEVDG